MRALAVVIILSGATLMPLLTRLEYTTPALACSIGPEMLDERVAEAQFIGLVEAVGVGGPENRAPTVTPAASASATRIPLRTAMSTPVSPPYAQPTIPPNLDPFQLSGVGATLRVVEQYIGVARDALVVDDADRANAERQWRIIEANPFPPRPCEPGIGLTRYDRGARYIALAADSPERGLHTVLALLVRGDEVDLSGVMMHGETYRRYFSGVPAEFSERGDAYLTAPRVPLATLSAAIIGMRGGGTPRIVPPATGSAGLASGRQ
jgi:hypothetical protein